MNRRFLINDPRVPAFVAASVGSTDTQCVGSVGLEKDGQIQIGVVFDNFSGANVFGHIASRDGNRIIDRDFFRMVFAFAFEVLKVRRISVSPSEANRKVCKLIELVGFKLEARLKEAAENGADALIYRMFRQDCRFLLNYA